MNTQKLFTIMLCMLCFTHTTFSQQSDPITISGTVRDAATGKPVPYILVECISETDTVTAFSGVDGRYKMTMSYEGNIGIGDKTKGNIAKRFQLTQNYPNPFNPATTIEFSIPQQRNVQLTIYNILGQKVITLIDKTCPAGIHSVVWNATDQAGKGISAGLYFYRLQAGDYVNVKKMILLDGAMGSRTGGVHPVVQPDHRSQTLSKPNSDFMTIRASSARIQPFEHTQIPVTTPEISFDIEVILLDVSGFDKDRVVVTKPHPGSDIYVSGLPMAVVDSMSGTEKVTVTNKRTTEDVVVDVNALGGFSPADLSGERGDTLSLQLFRTIEAQESRQVGETLDLPVSSSNPPKVCHARPANGDKDIIVDAVIVIGFTIPMDLTTITTQSFLLSSAQGNVDGSISFDSDMSASFTPAQPLLPSTEYTITLTTDITSFWGIPLEEEYTQTFTTSTDTRNALIPDFQVNENAGPNGARQKSSSISTDDSGNFVMTWMDERNGDYDIYAQRYSSDGTAMANNFQVNDVAGGFVWDLYGGWCPPSISADGSGNFVITWTDTRNGDWDIYAQLYSSDGNTIGTNFKVNDDQGGGGFPSISTDGSGNFVITWVYMRNGEEADIYAQRYLSNGTASGANFKVNDDQENADQMSPSISTDNSGNFVITWEDQRRGNDNIYAQRYSSNGAALGVNFKVNDDQGSAVSYYNPSISTDNSGNFVITWTDDRSGNDNIYAQRYSSNGTALGVNFKVNDDQGSADQWFSPSISADSSGNFVITWLDNRNGDADIYAQRYSSDGTALGTNFKVNDDQGSARQVYPSISTDNSGNFVITWDDERNGDSDIYAQRYLSNGTASGANFKVNDDQENADQLFPSISTDNSGNFVITWTDDRNGDWDIYAQLYSSDGSTLGTNFKVNDDQGSEIQWHPSISTDGSGNFVITWRDSRNGDWDIYVQRYSSGGSTLGTNFKVNDDQGSEGQWHPSISTDGSGNFVITWTDTRNGEWDIYTQRYLSDGTALGSNFKVNDDEVYAAQRSPSISTDENGNFVITWHVVRNGDWDIYAQRYSSDGNPLGTNFKVNQDQAHSHHSISTDNSGNFVITWMDDNGIYAQRYSGDGAAVGSNFRVTHPSNKGQNSPKVKLWNNRIYTTWADNRVGGTGYDIWANVLNW